MQSCSTGQKIGSCLQFQVAKQLGVVVGRGSGGGGGDEARLQELAGKGKGGKRAREEGGAAGGPDNIKVS